MHLELRGISKRMSDSFSLKNIELCVDKGELISLLGPSGCGKTTTLKIIGGFLKPDTGVIYLDNEDITLLDPNKRPVSTVFQNYALFPHMNVFENVSYGLKYKKSLTKKDITKKTEEMLEKVRLLKHKKQNVTKLSGGEQQRVALARSLILNPKVLLMDEPFSNLDVKLKIKMRDEIKAIQKELDITMIFVTHDQEEALSISDRIAIMNDGNVCQIGTPQEIYDKPANNFVADFIGRVNIFEINLKNLFVRPEDISISKINNKGIKGQVVLKQFMGAFTTYFVETDNNTIQVDVIKPQDKDWPLGEKVYLISEKLQ